RDGFNWQKAALPLFRSLGGLAYRNGVFVLVNGTTNSNFADLYASVDGAAWSLGRGPSASAPRTLLAANGTFLMTDDMGRIYQSDPVIRLALNRAAPNQLTLSAMSGQAYRVDYANSLGATTNWQTLTNVTLADTNTTATLRDSNAGSSARFYRA